MTRITHLGAPASGPERTADPAWSGSTSSRQSRIQRAPARAVGQPATGMESDPAAPQTPSQDGARELDKAVTTRSGHHLPFRRAIDPEFQLPVPGPSTGAYAPSRPADLMPPETAAPAYEAMAGSAEAQEGLGFLALRAGRTEEARRHFAKAVEMGSRNARAHLEAGSIETAAKLNPRWAEPYLRMAAKEKAQRRRIPPLTMAVKLDPRNSAACARWPKPNSKPGCSPNPRGHGLRPKGGAQRRRTRRLKTARSKPISGGWTPKRGAKAPGRRKGA